MTLIKSLKGMFGEGIVTLSGWLLLNSSVYHRMNNVTLPLPNGGTTQIDHVIVSRFGIFVIETKNYKGWIFGEERQPKWVQTFPNGSQFPFQNPLRQNYLHLKTLANILNLPDNKFHSVVVFIGSAELKTKEQLPDNVLVKKWTKYIKSKQHVLFTDEQVLDIVEKINSGKLKKSFKTNAQHKKYVQEKVQQQESKQQKSQQHNTNAQKITASQESPISNMNKSVTCPQCDSPMTKRTAKTGKNVGNQFWGCSRFPNCRGTRSM